MSCLTSNSVNGCEENRFNCPIDGCVYAINGDKYFKRKLFLTQHIANKHSEKKYSCDKCMKKYAIEWQLKYHQKSCGLQWSCGSCHKSYTERLSLVMHCKRHSHNLPKNNLIKSSKTVLNSPPINVQLMVFPLILNSNYSSKQLRNESTVTQNQRLILPKSDDSIFRFNSGTQTSLAEECNKCKTKSKEENNAMNLKKCNSIAIQTDRMNQKWCKSREQRSTESQTIRKRNRKPQTNNNFESIETQTLESTLHLTQSSAPTNCQKISASTSTSPPKKTKRRCLFENKISDELSTNNVKMSSAFTQTVRKSCTSTSTTTDNDSQVFVNNLNPLLSQIDSTNHILEQSVQTEAIEFCLDNEFNNIETQTVNLDISSDDLLDFGANEEFFFSEFTDIETQTIWNNDRTTQTDEYLDQINDVFLRYLDNDNECHNISNKTLFTDTETQTQIDFPLICSSAQTSQTFN